MGMMMQPSSSSHIFRRYATSRDADTWFVLRDAVYALALRAHYYRLAQRLDSPALVALLERAPTSLDDRCVAVWQAAFVEIADVVGLRRQPYVDAVREMAALCRCTTTTSPTQHMLVAPDVLWSFVRLAGRALV